MANASQDRFDFSAGQEARDKGIATVLANADEEWKSQVFLWIRRLPSGVTFTADDLTYAAGLPNRRNAIGAVFNTAAHMGLIVNTGATCKGARVKRHSGRSMIWRRR